MILVTGTKRSGTSMWMQILRAAGIRVLGDAFPRDWEEVLGEANPEGFYETILRRGIFYQTNPHPRTGEFLPPAETRDVAVKVFIPGVVRSDLAYVDKVLATMRHWREYDGSLRRLYSIEHRNRQAKSDEPRSEPLYVSPVLEWWSENYALLADVLTRGYPVHFIAYESVLAEPRTVVPEAIEWLGVGEPEAAAATVKPPLRTHDAAELPEVPGIEPEVAAVFDELYERVRDRRGLDAAFIEQLNALHERLQPRIAEEMQQVRRHRLRARRERRRRVREGAGEEGSS